MSLYCHNISVGFKLSAKLTNNTGTANAMFYGTDMENGAEATYLPLTVSQCNNKIHVKARPWN